MISSDGQGIRSFLFFMAAMSTAVLWNCGNSEPPLVAEARAALANAPEVSEAFPLAPEGDPIARPDVQSIALGASASGYLLLAQVGPSISAFRISRAGAIISTTPVDPRMGSAAIVPVGESWLVVYSSF